MSEKKLNSLPEYEDPPVVEVVMGAQFGNIERFKSPYLANFWDKIDRNIFSNLEEMAPLAKLNLEPGSVHFSTKLQQARSLFKNAEGDSLIQFQQDRLICNWKKSQQNILYPRYKSLMPRFYNFYQKFEETLNEFHIPLPRLEMLELTYVNLFPLSILPEGLSSLSKVLNDITWTPKNTLSLPKGIDFSWRFTDEKLKANMRIQVVSGQQREDGSDVIKIELSVRGPAPHANMAECRLWFDSSHEWIVKSFDEITAEYVHKKWKRK